jgi:hypothetical protein
MLEDIGLCHRHASSLSPRGPGENGEVVMQVVRPSSFPVRTSGVIPEHWPRLKALIEDSGTGVRDLV